MRKFFAIMLLFLSGTICLTWALQPDKKPSNGKKRTASSDQIVLLHADSMFFKQNVNPNAQFFVGNVKFEHNGAIMTCDSALYYSSSKSFDAYGRVRMVQGDTLTVTCDKMFYKGNEQLVQAREHVVLKHRKTILTSESIDYDRRLNVGQYFTGGTLVDENSELTSDTGYYHPNTRDAEFHHYVVLKNPAPPKATEYTLNTHLLYYNTGTTRAHVVGPSTIVHENMNIWTNSGYYISKTQEAYLLKDGVAPRIQHEYNELEGDSMHYDGATCDSKAYGNIKYKNEEHKVMFFGNYGLYNDSTGYAEAADSALCVEYRQPDTLFAHADTFKLFAYNLDTDSVYRILHAFNHVRAYRVDVQCVCDSMVYNGLDSCATLYKDPIMWQNEQQVLGEVIKAWVNDSTLDSVYVINQALMVDKIDDKEHYNQLSSNQLHSYFRDGDLYQNCAEDNVVFNYYMMESDEKNSPMIGMIHAQGKRMRMDLDVVTDTTDVGDVVRRNRLTRIWMPATTGEMFPLTKTPPDMLYLETFRKDGSLAWFDNLRPKSKHDLFVWEGKSEDLKLKQGYSQEPPKVSRDDKKKRYQEKLRQQKR